MEEQTVSERNEAFMQSNSLSPFMGRSTLAICGIAKAIGHANRSVSPHQSGEVAIATRLDGVGRGRYLRTLLGRQTEELETTPVAGRVAHDRDQVRKVLGQRQINLHGFALPQAAVQQNSETTFAEIK